MRRSGLVLGIIIVILIAVAAFAMNRNNSSTPQPATNNSQSSSNNNSSSQTSHTASATVDINNMAFTPSQITISKGGTVTWTNNDSMTHTVVDDLNNAGGPNSGDIAPGSNYSFTFTKTGSFQYHCSIHPSMRGTIVVQ
jgi:plastocyanin